MKVKCIPGYPGYKISENGIIYSSKFSSARINKPILKPCIDKDGYLGVTLFNKYGRKKFRLHRLVATVFIGNPPTVSHVVNHKNGIKDYNHYSNLEWLTAADNERHARKVLGKRCVGEKAAASKLKEKDILEIRRLFKTGLPGRLIAKKFGICMNHAYRIKNKVFWSHI